MLHLVDEGRNVDQDESETLTNIPMPIDEAVKRFFPFGGVTRSTLLSACRSGALSYAKIGNRYLVSRDDIDAWIAHSKVRKSTIGSQSKEPKKAVFYTSLEDDEFTRSHQEYLIHQAMGFSPPRKPRMTDIPDYERLPPDEQRAQFDLLITKWHQILHRSALNSLEHKGLTRLSRVGVNKPVKPTNAHIAPTARETLEIRGYIRMVRNAANPTEIISVAITSDGMKSLAPRAHQ